MRYIQQKRAEKVNWVISEQTRTIVDYYARFTGCTESEVVEIFLKNILSDPDFQHFLKTQRRTKRMVERIFYGDPEMKLLYEYSENYMKSLSDLAQRDMAAFESEQILNEESNGIEHAPRSVDRM